MVSLVALVVLAGGCGGGSSASGGQKVHFAKTKFALHAGLAFGAFHRYIYKPYKAGGFSPPSRHKAALVKAGLAAAFAYHETRLALNDARSSRLLSAVLGPVLALQDRLRLMSSRLKGGTLDSGDIQAANGQVNAIQADRSRAGQPIKDLPTPALH